MTVMDRGAGEFRLQPFRAVTGYAVCADIRRKGALVIVIFRVVGDWGCLLLPERGNNRQRKDELWQGTCFEIFIKEAASREYWEYNLAPGGNWNVYCFSDYRQGMTEEKRVTALPFTGGYGGQQMEMAITIDLGLLGLQGADLQVALSAVTLEKDHGLHHWALCHHGDKPDFHAGDGFILHLPRLGGG